MDTAIPLLPVAGRGAGCQPDSGGACACDAGAAIQTGSVETLVDRFLREQGQLTAVERFARQHAEGSVPAQARYYRDLMPAAPPGPGQQYAFEVDLDSCTGCKGCVTACRSLNGLDEDETWRSVGLLVGGADDVQQHVTAACHHCVEPACLAGCPVNAYEKDPDTGIVRHLDDQCIGCGYCTLTCPYEVPQYNRERGIVRKCDLCAGRLADGEAPACVQACPTQAISVRVVEVEALRTASQSSWPMSSPAPSRTVPATTYRTRRDLSAAQAADLHAVRPSHGHWPLAVMLVLTQFAVGTSAVHVAVQLTGLGEPTARAAGFSGAAALTAAVVALGASLLHLGRPRYAYRAVIGLRHSWLSREIAAFTAFAGLASLDAVWRLAGQSAAAVPAILQPMAVAAGVIGVGCSAMIYVVTGKRWWRLRTIGPKFALTAVAGGLATVLATTSGAAWAGGFAVEGARPLALALVAATLCKLGAEGLVLRHRTGSAEAELARTARLLTGPLAGRARLRAVFGLTGGALLPLLTISLADADRPDAGAIAAVGIMALAAVGAGELLERGLFFTAASARRMPGAIR